eukprot:CAMPEP_0183314528 /NCGR_PEP_ID=MMETSP0160_2-20130417/48721_1 /TAXON_ID=2839 ORGANISM="Odontella Sinensis, Strain Grunow 1884" /NCGR_SAMPLE_ID=MMETSP0160_2 /ASSEMBLY_ACC=CAM_ASM_000250 /LENGTH=211 /DNA_ID=CAMNT_0025479883 /DNA_START=6 /DNA_END=637 /DNA_ORIENTATION=+
MAKKPKQKRKKGKAKGASGDPGDGNADVPAGDTIRVDPRRIRFQYSRIRPHFSGCGRSVQGTLESIRNGEIGPGDLPPIQVLVGPEAEDGSGRWYFSLNNRRLWVLKRCREEGLLGGDNLIRVRVRDPKSAAERERYSVERCALEAKFIREKRTKEAPIEPKEEKTTYLSDGDSVKKADIDTLSVESEGGTSHDDLSKKAAIDTLSVESEG